MKAILVLDEMPSVCKDCNMSVLGREPHTGQMCFRCAHYPTIMVLTKETKRPDWCPLKPIPSRFNEEHFNRYEDGYNACIDEILGDKE